MLQASSHSAKSGCSCVSRTHGSHCLWHLWGPGTLRGPEWPSQHRQLKQRAGVLQKSRYETYVRLLVSRLHCPDDLDMWEEQLAREAGGQREPKPSLKKSHSSPSLHQDEAPTTAKVKRNISERRTYRKIIPKRNRNQL